MNMPRPSWMWIYGVIIIFIVGYWMFGPGNGVPVKSDWNTVAQMIEQGDVEKIQEIKARKGRVIAIVTKGDTVISKIADTCIELPETMECLDPLITTVPLQLLAYHIAVCKGMDVDRPRNLAKSVTVE